MNILSIVLQKMDMQSFMNSIILTKGLNVLKMSPMDQGRSIASGAPSEE